ncbi:MAG: hypothetical protein KGK11_08915 [Sphingomonadales bacterium]|nr:hypothetical protein [Sphingomonadales bacterium]
MKGCISRFRIAASAAPAARSQGIIMASGSASFTVDEVTFLVEVIVKRGVDR